MKRCIALLFGLIISFPVRCQNEAFIGYATAVVPLDGKIKTNVHGFSNREHALKYTSKTVQPIGSVSKTTIGIAMLIAQEKGMVDLDRDINDYLDFKVQNPYHKKQSPITLRQLATHTSGIVDQEKVYETAYHMDTVPKLTLGEFLKDYLSPGGTRYAKKNFLKSGPGSTYAYSNIAAALAAYTIEKATGKPFHLFTKEFIFKPLNMHNTDWFYTPQNLDIHAVLYDEKNQPLPKYSCSTYPDGSLKTTIHDLSIYLLELMKGYKNESKLLSSSSWNEFFKPHFNGKNIKNINNKEPDSGLFITHFKSGSLGHTGSDLGVCSVMLFDPETMLGKIFMANKDLSKQNLEAFHRIWATLK